MLLEEPFNKLAGKVVNNGEFTAKLKLRGFEDVRDSPQAQGMIMKKFQDEGTQEIISLLQHPPTTYLTANTAADIEKEILQKGRPEFTTATVNKSLTPHKDDLYVEILPSVKLVAWAFDRKEDKEFVAAFIKTAEECADHRIEVGNGLQDLSQALNDIQKKNKIKAKFGR